MAVLGEPMLMTVEQFDLLAERPDALEELHWGSLVTLSRPKPWHVKLQMKLAQLLQPLAGERGYVVIELPFRAIPQYDLRCADVAFVSKSRWDETNELYLAGAPELVIEILSPSNTASQLREYAALCLANGCREFWVVDRNSQTVSVTRQSGLSAQFSQSAAIPLTAMCDGEISVASIFSGSYEPSTL